MNTKFILAASVSFLACVVLGYKAKAGGTTNVVSSPDEGGLQTAIARGGWVGIEFNGTVVLTNTIAVTNQVVLDGSRYQALISGGNAVRLFHVANGASLTISNLTLANGNITVAPNGASGATADAGGIYNDGGMLALVGCTLTNNSAQSLALYGLGRGGAVFNNGGTVFLIQSAFVGNSVVGGNQATSSQDGFTGQGLGGAVYNASGTLTMIQCSVIQNTCFGSYYSFQGGTGVAMGGGLCEASGSLTITNSSFAFNQAIGNGYDPQGSPACPAFGGAIAVEGGILSVNHSQILTNQASGGSSSGGGGAGSGGGLATTTSYCGCSAVVAIGDSAFYGNQALGGSGGAGNYGFCLGAGGGIYNDTAGVLSLNRCSFCSNLAAGGAGDVPGYGSLVFTGGAAEGGGIYNSAQMAATNCTLALNSAKGGPEGITGPGLGGGVFNAASATFVGMNLTIASNNCSSPTVSSSTNGLAAGSQIANTNGTCHAHNSIFAGGTNSNAYGTITDDGCNICSDGSANLTGSSSYNHTDPLLGPLGDYGGPTLCLALLAGSPAMDHADPNDFPSTDQRGYFRPFGNGPDIGAFEYGSGVPDAPPTLGLSTGIDGAKVWFAAFPPHLYRLQWSTNLITWTDFSTNGPMTGAMTINQTVGGLGCNRCYFRVCSQ